MSGESPLMFTGVRVPQEDAVVKTPTGECLPVRTEHNPPGPRHSPGEDCVCVDRSQNPTSGRYGPHSNWQASCHPDMNTTLLIQYVCPVRVPLC